MFTKKRNLSNDHRALNEKWELDYFIYNNKNKIKRHYTTLHEEKYKKHNGKARKIIVAEYKKKVTQ